MWFILFGTVHLPSPRQHRSTLNSLHSIWNSLSNSVLGFLFQFHHTFFVLPLKSDTLRFSCHHLNQELSSQIHNLLKIKCSKFKETKLQHRNCNPGGPMSLWRYLWCNFQACYLQLCRFGRVVVTQAPHIRLEAMVGMGVNVSEA